VTSANRPINSALVGLELGPVDYTWGERDAILYAISVGARYPADIEFLYEAARPDGLRVTSAFVLTAVTRMLPGLIEALAIDVRRLLHISQDLYVHRVPRPAGSCRVGRSVTGVWDKGKAAIVDCFDTVHDEDGLLACARSSWWIAGAGGFGGQRSPDQVTVSIAVPPRAADSVAVYPTNPEQAALYRLNGDLNPVHIDPVIAREAGQPQPFLHGLCTFGAVAHQLERRAPVGRRLSTISGRFRSPVFPGDRLDVEVWEIGADEVVATVTSHDTLVLGPIAASYAREPSGPGRERGRAPRPASH
jgi:acyl dehydratase